MAEQWRVTSQKLETVPNPEGSGFSQQWNVSYLVHSGPATGTRGEVHVPAQALNADELMHAINVQVAKHQAVAAL